MTSQEMEIQITSLREQVSQLQQQRELQRKHWFRWGLVAGGIGLVLTIVGVMIIPAAVGSISPTMVLGLAGFQLIVLSGALGTPTLPPAKLSVRSRLTWGWSGPRSGWLV